MSNKPNISDEILAKWQKIVDLLARTVGVPAGLIMRVYPDEIEVFVSSKTNGNPYEVGDREHLNSGLYCETVMAQRDMLLVPNALLDPDWDDNPDIKLNMIAYLGYPLTWPDGEMFGTICVLDNKGNAYSEAHKVLIQHFSEIVEGDLHLLEEMSKREQAEAALERQHELLEKLIQERTKELENQLAEREQAEDALHESEALYRQLFEGIDDAITVHDYEANILDVNKAACRRLGYTREELLQMKTIDLDEANYGAGFKERLQQQIDEGKLSDITGVHITKDGRRIDIDVNSKLITYKEQPAVLAVVRDITERKRSERMLQVRVRLSEFAITHSADELMQKTLDEVEELTDSQIAFFHFLGADQETLILQAWSTNTLNNMCNAEGKGHHYPVSEAGVWTDCIHQRQPVIHNDYISLPHQKGMPDGHAEVVRELVVPIMRNDLIVAILGVGNKPTDYDENDVEVVYQLANMAWDIIARKQAEVELQKSEELLALKDRFVSIVSHEFRTPLAVIQSSSDLLQRYADRMTVERKERAFRQINQQIQSLKQMIDQVLSLGRAQSGMVEFNPTPVELTTFCHNVFEQIQLTDTSNHLFEFTSTISDQLAMIDADLMQRVLTNLLQNAIKYSPEGTRITLELNQSEDKIVMLVHDEGIGVPEEDQAGVFDPFNRASNVGKSEGTGLGLSIVREYVQLHGGSIEVESDVGSGSTFRVILPIK